MKYLKGIDVSEHQGVIDWPKVKESGINFVMIRAGYGKNNIDKQFVNNITTCNRLGIPCGVYWFSYAYTDEMAKNEAEYCIAAIKPYKVEFPVVFDFEYDSVNYAAKKGVTVSKTLASNLVKAFCDTVENAGYFAMNYANQDYLNRYFAGAAKTDYDLWLAEWPSDPNFENPPACGIWQYTSKGKVDGIKGNVDMNITYNDYSEIIKNAGLNKLVKQESTKWYSDAQKWVIEKGISDGTRPEEPTTRAEVWAMLQRLSK